MLIYKNKTINKHAKKRAKQRYETIVDDLLVNGILSRIQKGKGKILKIDKKTGRIVYKVKYRNSFIVLVNKDIDHIITFLPKDYKCK